METYNHIFARVRYFEIQPKFLESVSVQTLQQSWEDVHLDLAWLTFLCIRQSCFQDVLLNRSETKAVKEKML
jgi:hypothetical protein